MGLNIAFQLKRRAPEMKIVIVEQAKQLGNGSSGYSTGFCRAFYSFDNTMKFAVSGIDAYKNFSDYIEAPSEVKYHKTGALWMMGKTQCENESMKERLGAFGVETHVLDETLASKQFPLMNFEAFPEYNDEGDIVEKEAQEFWALSEPGAGNVDSNLVIAELKEACERKGVEFQWGTKVNQVTIDGGKCTGLELASGDKISAGAVMNCAGPWCNKLTEKAGVKIPFELNPTRIQVAHKYIEGDFNDLPFVADCDSGIYFMPRKQNNQLVIGSIAHKYESEIVDPDAYDTNLDPDFKTEYLAALFHRLPTLPQAGQIVGFSSMYTVCEEDVHPVIGPSELENFWVCNGFSGHGFKLAPAVGSGVAQKLTGITLDSWETDVPIEHFDPYRTPLKLKQKTHFA